MNGNICPRLDLNGAEVWKNHFGSKENDVSYFITRLPLLSQTEILIRTAMLM